MLRLDPNVQTSRPLHTHGHCGHICRQSASAEGCHVTQICRSIGYKGYRATRLCYFKLWCLLSVCYMDYQKATYMCSIVSVVNKINCFISLIRTQAIHIITSFNHELETLTKTSLHSTASTNVSSIVLFTKVRPFAQAELPDMSCSTAKWH